MNEVIALNIPEGNRHSRKTEFPDVAVLLVGHGTRQQAGQDEFRKLYRSFDDCIAPLVAELAFLELAEPSISQAVMRIATNKKIRRLLVVPTLLFTAGHALEDIPRAIAESLRNTGIELIGQTAAFECSPEVLQLSAIRFRQTACPEAECVQHLDHYAINRTRPLTESAPCTAPCKEAHWILVGRGSSSQSAAAKMREFCRLRQHWTPVREATTAFIYGQSPTVHDAFQAAACSDAGLIVVQPHLLFSGLLLDELTEKVFEFSGRNPHQRWLITQPLGADRKLAELLANMARNRLLELLRGPGA